MTSSSESTRAKVRRSTIWNTNSKVLGQGMGLVTVIILTRMLGKDDFGLMAMAIAFMGLIDNFIDLGFLSAIIQTKDISQKELSSCFWFLLVISLLASGSIFFAAPFISMLFAEPRLSELIIFMALTFFFAPWNIVARGILSRDLRLDVIAKIELYASIVKMFASVVLASLGMGVWSLVYGYMIEKVFLSVLASISAKWYPRLVYEGNSVRQLMQFGLYTTTSGLLFYLYTRADIFIIGRLLGAEVLGIYSIASQIPQAIARLIPATWHRIAFPLFSRYQDSPKLNEIVVKSSSLISLVCLPLFVGLVAIAQDVINIFYGINWQAATYPMQILCFVAAIETVSGILPNALNAIGRPGINAVINFIAALVFPPILYLGGQQWGLDGVLWGVIALYSYRYLAFLKMACQLFRLQVSTYIKQHLGSIVAVTIMFIAVLFSQQIGLDWNIYVRMISSITIGALTYIFLQLIVNRELIYELVSFVKPT